MPLKFPRIGETGDWHCQDFNLACREIHLSLLRGQLCRTRFEISEYFCSYFQGYDCLLNIESLDKKLIHIEEQERYVCTIGFSELL